MSISERGEKRKKKKLFSGRKSSKGVELPSVDSS